MLLGYQRLKRWLALLLATASKDVNLRPIMFAAVRRGLLMEELVAGTGDEEMRSEMFICGVFSLLDRMFQEPFAKLLGSIPVPERVYQALVDETGPYQPYLAMVRAVEGESVYDYPRRGRAAADERRRDQPRAAARADGRGRARMRIGRARRCPVRGALCLPVCRWQPLVARFDLSWRAARAPRGAAVQACRRCAEHAMAVVAAGVVARRGRSAPAIPRTPA